MDASELVLSVVSSAQAWVPDGTNYRVARRSTI